MFALEVEKAGIDKLIHLLRRVDSRVREIPVQMISDLTAQAYRNVRMLIKWENHYRRGTLYKSIQMKVTPGGGATIIGRTPAQGIVGSGRKTALWLEEGTKPHWIVAKNKKCLAFSPVAAQSLTGGGRMYRARMSDLKTQSDLVGEKQALKNPSGLMKILVKKVWHPGTKPYRIFKRALQEALNYQSELVSRAVEKLNRGL